MIMKVHNVLIAFLVLTISVIHSMEPIDRLSKLVADAKASGLEMNRGEIDCCRGYLMRHLDIFIHGEERPEYHSDPYVVVTKDENSKLGFSKISDKSMRWESPLQRQIYRAIMQDTIDFDLVTKLLNNCDQHPIKNSCGKTLLHSAAKRGNVYLVNLLITHYHYDVNARDDDDMTPLHCAAKLKNPEVAQILIEHGAEMYEGTQDTYNMYPIEYAAQTGRLALVQLFLDKGFPVNHANEFGVTALHSAVKNPKVVKLLIARGADVNALSFEDDADHIGSPLHKAIAFAPKIGVIQLLLDARSDVNCVNSAGDTVVDYCLDTSPYRSVDEGAVKRKARKTFCMEMLLSYGAQIPKHLESHEIIKKAQANREKLAQAQSFKEVRLVLEQGIYPIPVVKVLIACKRKELFDAIAVDDVDTTKRLLKDGFTLKTRDKDKNTLVHQAIQATSKKCFILLMFLGAHKYFDKRNAQGLTPVHLFVEYNKFHLMTPAAPDAKDDTKPEPVGNKRKHEDS